MVRMEIGFQAGGDIVGHDTGPHRFPWTPEDVDLRGWRWKMSFARTICFGHVPDMEFGTIFPGKRLSLRLTVVPTQQRLAPAKAKTCFLRTGALKGHSGPMSVLLVNGSWS